jgi:hypothetical protein
MAQFYTGAECRTVQLPTGTLEVRVDEAQLPLDELCGFAARHNPKRGFLFVSRVLGRHIPVPPARMRDAHDRLATRIPADLPGPVLFLGMAETAIGLGHGVHEAYLRATGRTDTLCLHSTRYRLEHEALLRFEEEHSHATSHIVYRPESRAQRRLLDAARSVVVVDDEASTGKTFANLVRAMAGALPRIERAALVVITDWCGDERRARALADTPVPAHFGSLLAGTYTFAPAEVRGEAPRSAVGTGEAKDALLPRDYGRLGSTPNAALIEGMARGLFRTPGERLLVLGTGEFVHPPFLLASALERLGADVHFQATTRSPALVGHSMECALRFEDNYEDGIPNFLYNARRGGHDRVLLCHETPAATLDRALVDALDAHTVAF